MIITCECGYEDEKLIRLNLSHPVKASEVVWTCENCGKLHIIKVELLKGS